MSSRVRYLMPVLCSLLAVSPARSGALFAPGSRLTPNDGAPDDDFGFAVALQADTAVVGADGDDNERGLDAGAAYVYVRSGSLWAQQAKLVPSVAGPGDLSGYSVALSGDTLVIGAPQANGGTGAAYVYIRTGDAWSLQQRLTPADGIAGGYYGFSVSVDHDTALVGAVGDDDRGASSGAAYVYVRSGSAWALKQKVAPPDAVAGDSFGWAVWVDGDAAAMTSFGDDDRGTDSGSAYVFARVGGQWSLQQKLTAPDGAGYDGFGYACVLKGTTLAVTAPYDDTVAGTDAGSLYTFTRPAASWFAEPKLTASDAAATDRLGIGLGMDGDTIALGAINARVFGKASGAGYVFRRISGAWQQTSRLQAPDASDGDNLGVYAAVSGARALLGATQPGQGKPGVAWVFSTETTASPGIAALAVSDATGNGAMEFNECGELTVTLRSAGGSTSGVTGTLAALTPGVSVVPGAVAFGTLPALGTVANGQAFRFFTAADFPCGAPMEFLLTLNTDDGAAGLPFTLPSGVPSTASFSVLGPVPVPDNDPAGASLPLTVAGVSGPIAKVVVSLHVKHAYDGDLQLYLVAPDGTTVQLADRVGGGGDNFGLDCPAGPNDTTLDDDASSSIATGVAPFISAYRPAQPLAALYGKSGAAVNGVWRLRAVDNAPDDAGAIQCWTLAITTLQCADGGGPCEGWAGLAGDLDNDGKVTIADVAFALSLSAGASNSSPPVVARGDVAPKPSAALLGYGDGQVDLRDAVRILRAANGLLTLP